MYSKIYQNILFPFYETIIRRRNTLFYLKELERNQWRSQQELRIIQWNKLKRLLKHAYEKVPYYRNKFKQQDLDHSKISTPEDFRKLPFLTKGDIQSDGASLIAGNYIDKNVCDNETGGSTGEPIRFVFPRESYEWRMAGALRSNRWTGWDLGEKTTLIWGRALDKGSVFKKVKVMAHHIVMRRQYINAFFLSNSGMSESVRQIATFRPEFIESYVSPLYSIAEYILENNIRGIRPRAIITSAENLYDHQRALIETAFNCKIFNRYGCSEMMLIAAECDRHAGMHINMDNTYVEFIKDGAPATVGETGEIVITDLNNYGMPFIRYKIGDMGVPSARMCGCGRGLDLMEAMTGRTMDILFTLEGNFIQPQIFCFLFKEFQWIRQYQIVQHKKGYLKFNVVKRMPLSQNEKEKFVRRIVEAIHGTAHITLEIVDDIPLTRSGKFRMVVRPESDIE